MPSILIADDEARISGFIDKGLRAAGFATQVATTGTDALSLALTGEFDLLVLDVNMPGLDGFEVLEQLRGSGSRLPVIMLTARVELEDTVAGLEGGADDYLGKPFRFDELLARIRALVRRGGADRMETLRYGPLAMDRLRHVATANDKPLDLTPKEFQLLEYFLMHPEEVVRRTTLLEKVWDMHFDPESNVVDVHVGNLRRKLKAACGDQLVDTVRGVGFALRDSSGKAANRERAARA